jgi:hypothetical protein
MGHALIVGCEETETLWHADGCEFVLGEWK